MEIIHFHNNTSIHKQKKNSISEICKRNEDISFSKFVNSLNLDQNTYILILKSKLTNPHFF